MSIPNILQFTPILTLLQRHILVKGCGKAGDSDAHGGDGAKSESGSDTQDNSNLSMAA